MKRGLVLRQINEFLNTLNGISHFRSSGHQYKLPVWLRPTVGLVCIWFFGRCLNMLGKYLEGAGDTETPNKYTLILLQVLTDTRTRQTYFRFIHTCKWDSDTPSRRDPRSELLREFAREVTATQYYLQDLGLY